MCSFKQKQVIITLKISTRLFWNFCYLNCSWNCSTFASFSQLLSPPPFPPPPPLTSFFLTQLSVSFTPPLPLSCSLSYYSSLCLCPSIALYLFLFISHSLFNLSSSPVLHLSLSFSLFTLISILSFFCLFSLFLFLFQDLESLFGQLPGV